MSRSFETPLSRREFTWPYLVLCVSLFIFGAFYAANKIGVWLPDVVFPSEKVISQIETTDKHRFAVTQIWNQVDFYSTFLKHENPDGRIETYVIDGDDLKAWSYQFTLDESTHTVRVDSSGHYSATYDWKKDRYTNHNGDVSSSMEGISP